MYVSDPWDVESTMEMDKLLSSVSTSVPIRVIDALPSSNNSIDISSATGGSFTEVIVMVTLAATSEDSSPSFTL